jgi:signal transduction histidine kinase
VQTVLRPAASVGDPVLVERLVTNLIDNAVRHNVPDGWIQVATGTRDGMVFIDVANGGSVIPESEVPALFEPFRRHCDRTASPSGVAPGQPDGAGLGLSIVQSVVAAHLGQVTARPGSGGGLEISVLLPAPG